MPGPEGQPPQPIQQQPGQPYLNITVVIKEDEGSSAMNDSDTSTTVAASAAEKQQGPGGAATATARNWFAHLGDHADELDSSGAAAGSLPPQGTTEGPAGTTTIAGASSVGPPAAKKKVRPASKKERDNLRKNWFA